MWSGNIVLSVGGQNILFVSLVLPKIFFSSPPSCFVSFQPPTLLLTPSVQNTSFFYISSIPNLQQFHVTYGVKVYANNILSLKSPTFPIILRKFCIMCGNIYILIRVLSKCKCNIKRKEESGVFSMD